MMLVLSFKSKKMNIKFWLDKDTFLLHLYVLPQGNQVSLLSRLLCSHFAKLVCVNVFPVLHQYLSVKNCQVSERVVKTKFSCNFCESFPPDMNMYYTITVYGKWVCDIELHFTLYLSMISCRVVISFSCILMTKLAFRLL